MDIYCTFVRRNWFAVEWHENFHATLNDFKRNLHILSYDKKTQKHLTSIYEFRRLYQYCHERGVDLCVNRKVLNNYKRWRYRKAALKKQKANDQVDIALWTDDKKHQLYPYQKIGINTILTAMRFVLADQVGVGKTPQAIGVLLKAWEEYGGDTALLVCPNRIKSQWKKELLAFTKLKSEDITIFDDVFVCPVDADHHPHVRCAKCKACKQNVACLKLRKNVNARRAKQISEAKILICHYQALRINEALLIKKQFDVTIFDEASFIKNWEAQVTKAAFAITSSLPPWAIVLPMSGTIIENRIEEIYPIVSMVDDAVLGPHYNFKKRYLICDYWRHTVSINHEDELRKKLNSVLIRRTIDDVWKERPPLIEMIRECVLLPYQAKVYEEARNNILQSIKDAEKAKQINNAMLATMMNYLLQICDTVKSIDPACDHKDHSGKFELLKDMLENEIGRSEKVVIFSKFANKVIPYLMQLLKECDMGTVAKVVGGVSPKDSAAIMQHFCTSRRAKFLVCSDALAYGANLQAAKHVINFDLPWNPAKVDQRVARVYRRGQDKAVNVFNFIVTGTIEEHLYAVINDKRGLAAKFIRQAKGTGTIDFKALAKMI